jgi:hypothetical protein
MKKARELAPDVMLLACVRLMHGSNPTETPPMLIKGPDGFPQIQEPD